jgi:hypothetical protein
VRGVAKCNGASHFLPLRQGQSESAGQTCATIVTGSLPKSLELQGTPSGVYLECTSFHQRFDLNILGNISEIRTDDP